MCCRPVGGGNRWLFQAALRWYLLLNWVTLGKLIDSFISLKRIYWVSTLNQGTVPHRKDTVIPHNLVLKELTF